MISIISITTSNNIINKHIYFKIKENIKWIKKKINNKIIIIEKKIWILIKNKIKNKTSIVIDENIKKKYLHLKKKKTIFIDSIIQALNIAKKKNKEIIIIGDNKIYFKIIKWAKKIYFIYINKKNCKNIFFSKYNHKKWKVIYRKKKKIQNININYIIFSILIKI